MAELMSEEGAVNSQVILEVGAARIQFIFQTGRDN